MAKWQYCTIAYLPGMTATVGVESTEKEIIITRGLHSAEPVKNPEKGQLMKTLHELGADGWEAVTMQVQIEGGVVVLLKKSYT